MTIKMSLKINTLLTSATVKEIQLDAVEYNPDVANFMPIDFVILVVLKLA